MNRFEYYNGTLPGLVELGKNATHQLVKMILVHHVSEKLIRDLKGCGIDLPEGYRHTIDTFAVKHTLNQHGSATEEERGQIPIVEEDFLLLPDIIEQYDEISIEKNKRGQNVILYKKSYDDGRIVYLEEIRSPKRGELAFVSMRKYKKKSGFPNETF